MRDKELVDILIDRFFTEKDKKIRSGIYGLTQKRLAYNSNRIEGSTLTPEQTATLFDEGFLPRSDDFYRAKDIEEMNGHFLMFNKMLNTLNQPLSEDLIKSFHHELKSGVFEDRANGYAIGEYKRMSNIIGFKTTTKPEDVPKEMAELLQWYNDQEKDISTFAKFHAKYEQIHPFQDGNGRTGRMILFRECLKNFQIPVIIEFKFRNEYIQGLQQYKSTNNISELTRLFASLQKDYRKVCLDFCVPITHDAEGKRHKCH